MTTNNNSPPSTISNEEIINGINLLWNNKFDEADQVFKSKKDTNPRYALHYAEVSDHFESKQSVRNTRMFARISCPHIPDLIVGRVAIEVEYRNHIDKNMDELLISLSYSVYLYIYILDTPLSFLLSI